MLKSSNQVLNEMKEENALETIEETMDLLQSNDIYQSKIRGLLEEFGAQNIDEDISKEYEWLDSQEMSDGMDQLNQLDGEEQVQKKKEVMLN